jgi:hypothetical protein
MAMVKEVDCHLHGRQGIGLVCTHVAYAIDSGEPVGFFWSDNTDTGCPDAWCAACERALLAVPADQSTDDWFRACQFKILCVRCWT